ncbi:Uncharacterized protein APZ42_012962 [Daphnia magna]|uniref:Uncharacterized protein n=1 Tax=Daphnia magna TaxID=35525 RepID=A0A0P5S6X0_9CRUS|nr:Uncharacterized protein APZ42_012962 [Daphnia magna]
MLTGFAYTRREFRKRTGKKLLRFLESRLVLNSGTQQRRAAGPFYYTLSMQSSILNRVKMNSDDEISTDLSSLSKRTVLITCYQR